MSCLVLSVLGILLLAMQLPSSCDAKEGATNIVIHHDMTVTVAPEKGLLRVRDAITLPKGHARTFLLHLHSALEPAATPGVSLSLTGREEGQVPVRTYRVELGPGIEKFEVSYSGEIRHAVESYGKEQARGFRMTPGMISSEGVYLSGSSLWYPRLGDELLTFSLSVDLPKGWSAVSQGDRRSLKQEPDRVSMRWETKDPMDEIFLIAGKFTEYSRPVGTVSAMVFLRSPDRELADRYLAATEKYLPLYEQLIGPYPFTKFAMVENFWETGLGMPSFTLLGARVIRLPFILDSSYPHEILHNWWGNSVFPDYEKGNWSEGLTAYLADHLIKEEGGKGPEYRQETLQKYADYVRDGRDFPLTRFQARHSSPSEAVGYGKSLMLFHMLRLELGDEAFLEGLRYFYGRKRFSLASFDDLRESFEKVSGRDLSTFFDQWVRRTGAPELRLGPTEVKRQGDGYTLRLVIEQIQGGKPYLLRVPVAVTMDGMQKAHQQVLTIEDEKNQIVLTVPGRPLRIDLDPQFDLFRRLGREESPPALTQALGAGKMIILLPSQTGKSVQEAYRAVAEGLANSGPDKAEILNDRNVEKLPTGGSIAILGWENLFAGPFLETLAGFSVLKKDNQITIAGAETPLRDHSFILAGRHPLDNGSGIIFVASDRTDALPGLSRKLPHYHKYSYLAFRGPEPENVLKGRWPVLDSPMTSFILAEDGSVRRVGMAALGPRRSLASLAAADPRPSHNGIMETVAFLSGEDLEGRGLGTRGLDKAAEFIAGRFRAAGLKPAGEGESYFQSWTARAGEPERPMTLKNVIGLLPGKNGERSDGAVVVGAHYDHLGRGWPDVRGGNEGKIHPGADDNASGVAVMIELARELAAQGGNERDVIFIAFTGEESGRKGSLHFLANYVPSAKIFAMVNLDTVGRLEQGKLLIIGTQSAKEWPHIFRGAATLAGIEIETVPGRLDASDNVSFEDAGIPAVQLFTGPHSDYHRPADRLEKLKVEGLIKVASLAREVVKYLASRKESLTATAAGASRPADTGGRKVSLGTIPDFTFQGTGCRLSGVVPGSAAEACGLQPGDVITAIDGMPVTNLADFAAILRGLTPGRKVSLTLRREGREMKLEAEVRSR